MDRSISVIAFGEVVPGAASDLREGAPVGLSALRGFLQMLREKTRIVPLGAGETFRPPGTIPPTASGRPRVALAFVGGFSGQVEYAAPLASALGLPAHLFVPLARVGLPGRAAMRAIRTAGALPGIRLEADLSADCPPALRDRVAALCRTADSLVQPTGRAPRHVWMDTADVDARVSLLLSATGFARAVCHDPPRALIERGLPLLSARHPHAVWGRVALDCSAARS